jgi:hypothetical protein
MRVCPATPLPALACLLLSPSVSFSPGGLCAPPASHAARPLLFFFLACRRGSASAHAQRQRGRQGCADRTEAEEHADREPADRATSGAEGEPVCNANGAQSDWR